MVAIIVIAIIVVLLIVFVFSTYNRFVKLGNRVQNAWSQVNVELQRRYDLVPNLVQTVQSCTESEQEAINDVANACNRAMAATTMGDRLSADSQLTRAIGSLVAVSQRYPQLQSSQNFAQMQRQLQDCEDRISHMRLSFNDTVMKYNTAISSMPGALVARMFHFTTYGMFASQSEAQRAPQVDFDNRR